MPTKKREWRVAAAGVLRFLKRRQPDESAAEHVLRRADSVHWYFHAKLHRDYWRARRALVDAGVISDKKRGNNRLTAVIRRLVDTYPEDEALKLWRR